MWGKHFASMYEGSMYGAGVAVFAVWGYAIANARFGRIELNPKKLADTLGGTKEEITSAIEYLCSPDPESRFKEKDGRRLIQEGAFQYAMPSWDYYHRIRREEDRREQNRRAQEKYRQKRQAADSSGTQSEQGEKFMTIHQKVNKIVEEDPITKTDKANMEAKWGKKGSGTGSGASPTVEREYDLDYPETVSVPKVGQAAEPPTGTNP